jgi:hypothetical protein
MKSSTLSQPARGMIAHYESLRFGSVHVSVPYFNNKRQQVRGALRVLVGKGAPAEIEEEAQLIALRCHTDLATLSAENLKKFLVDNNLGIDCSGFVYHVLNAEAPLAPRLTFPNVSLLRKLLTKLRPIENTNVKVFAHKKNSTTVPLSDVQAGDIITMVGSKKVGNPDHILLVEEVNRNAISYVHAYKFASDGTYNHGIKHGTIEMTDSSKPITEQVWDSEDVRQAVVEASEVCIKRISFST